MAKRIVADDAKFSAVSVGKEKIVLPVLPDKPGDALSASLHKKKYRNEDVEDEALDDKLPVIADAEQVVPDSAFAAAEQPMLLAQADIALAPAGDSVAAGKTDVSNSGSNAGWWWLGAGVVATGAGIGVAVSGGGGGGNSGSGTTTITGTVTDGPVQGAKLYIDVNGNGTYDEGTDTEVLDANGEPVVTDEFGNFSFTVTGSGAGIKLVTNGGIDTVTGEAVTLDFSAPAGYSQINPITSAIAAYMEAHPGITAAQAEAAVESALGLPDLDYSTVNLANPPAGLAAADILAAQQAVAILATAAIIIERSGTDADAFRYIAANLGVSGSTSALVTAVQIADPTSAAQLTETVAAIEAATTLDAVDNALNDTFHNDPPVFTSATTVSVAENSTAVTTVAATDPDPNGQIVTYSITGGADQAKFTINSTTGALAFIGAPDFENPTDSGNNNSYEVQVTADDGNDGSTVQTFTATVTNVNEVPVITSASTGTVAENAATITVVYTAAATDVDAGDTRTYSLSGTDAALFNIDATSGAVTLKNSADFEAATSYAINVVATDAGGLTATQAVTVNVTNVNEAPIITSASTGTVAENAATTTVVYTAAVTDAGSTITYSLSGTDAALFNIDAASGAVTLQNSANYEADASYAINVIATDADGLTATQAVTVNVTNVNEAPVITSASTGTVAENAATSTAVYTATATDIDAGDTRTYSLSGTDAALFNIDATSGTVTLQSSADYEADTSYAINVIATDAGGLTATQAVIVNVTNVNEAPVITSASTGTVAENAATSTVIYAAVATDADVGDTRTYSLSGADAALFNIDATSGAVTLQSSADYEADTSYAINVIATDTGGLTATQAVIVNVTNLNDNPVGVINDGNIAANVVAENAANGTAVGVTAQTTDADAGATIIYSLSDNAGGRFAIDATSGIITIADGTLLDYESATSHDVTVLATSTDGSTNNQLFTINLADINEAPLVTSGGTGTVDENADPSTVVYTATASDVDAGQTLVYSLGGVDGTLFAIDPATGDVTLNVSANYETKANYNINVIATDNGTGTLSSTQAVTINVSDVNDNPVFTSANTINVAENNIEVMTIAATDEDLPALSVSYGITGVGDDGHFLINSNTGELTFSNPPDFESPNSAAFSNTYEVEVTAYDSSGGSTIQVITVTVTDVNEAPTITSDITGTVVENVDIGTVVYTVAADDPDPSDTLTYSLSGTDAAAFNIDGTTGEVRLNASADYETQASYSINVVATDDGPGLMSSTQAVTINVSNINELDSSISAITDSDPGANQIAEFAGNGTAVGIIASATDSDLATISYSLSDDAGGRFTIDASSGSITLLDNTLLDYATATSHDVTVLATSSDGSINEQVFTINVVDTTPPHLISSVFEDISGTGTLDAGDKLHLTFDEVVNIDTTGIYMAAFGSGATLAAVAPDGNGFSSEWDLTFGSEMAIAPNALNLSGAVSDSSGNINDNLAVPFHAPVQVVVDSSGAYIDANRDGLKDAGDTALADFGFGGNADLGRLAVQVAFTNVPTTALDLTGFNHDDRIVINTANLNPLPGGAITTIQSNYFTNNTSSGSITKLGVNLVSSPSERLAFVNDSMPHALQLYGIDNVSTATELLADFGTADLLANSRFIHQVAFVKNTGHVNVVVDANGDAYVDADDNGLLDAGDTVLADLGFFGNESLAGHSVDITFTAPVTNPLDLGGFGADDRIHINLDSPGFDGFAGIGARGISDVSYSSLSSRLNIYGNSASLTVDITSSGSMYLRGRMFLGLSVNTTVPLARFNSSMIDGLGSIIQRVDFVGNVALVPHELGTPAVQDVRVAVDANGAWIDDNNDGRVNDSNTIADFTAGGNADLSNNAVDITVSGFPGILDLSGFNADDRIHINLNGSGIRALMSTAGVTTVDAGNIKLWVSASSQRSGLSALHQSVGSWHTTQAVSVSAGSSGLRIAAWGSTFSSQLFATFGTENLVIDGSGNLMQQVDFVRLPIPQQHVVVESDGNWLDTNADGVHDSVNETTAADFSLGGNADLGSYAVNIHFNDLPVGPIDLSGFDGNDRIEIDVTAMRNNVTVADTASLNNQSTQTMGGQTQVYAGVSGVLSGSTAVYLSSGGNLRFGHRTTTPITPTSTVFNTYYTATGTLEGVIATNAGAIANNFQQVVFVTPPPI